MLRHLRSVQVETGDLDLLSLCEIGKVILANRCGEVARTVDERRLFGGEIVQQAEEQHEVRLARLLEQDD